jgi:hypothetical protein
MTTDPTKPTDTEWKVEYAKRSLASIADDAKADIRSKMDSIRRALDDAERRLDANEMPNTCGILQGRAFELEMALARFAAMRDAKPAIAILANVIDALATSPNTEAH